jgi:hypothetical protein
MPVIPATQEAQTKRWALVLARTHTHTHTHSPKAKSKQLASKWSWILRIL